MKGSVQKGRVSHGRPDWVDFENVTLECVDELSYMGDMISVS